MYKNILLPTDGSALSQKAVAHGVKLAQAVGARVTGFFAAPPATPVIYKGVLPVGLTSPKEHARMIERAAAQHLDYIRRAAAKAGVACKCLHETSDFPAEAILAAAKKEKCDLIVMASRSRRGLSGVLLGSQTQKVMAHAPVPVLVQR